MQWLISRVGLGFLEHTLPGKVNLILLLLGRTLEDKGHIIVRKIEKGNCVNIGR